MLPSIQDWLSASWADFRRRWLALMAVLGLTSLATAFAVLLPVVPAGFAGFLGVSPWLAWGPALTAALLAGLYLSTWGQAALTRAAALDEPSAESLAAGWRQTPEFGLALSLVLLAAGGGFVLLVVPGLVLAALLLFAPFYQLSGEERGLASLELSWARARPALGAVCARLVLAVLIAIVPSWLPFVGWLVGPLWAPFGLVACARLAADLKAMSPAPERPRLLVPVAALGAVLVLATGAASYGAARAVFAVSDAYASGRLTPMMPDSMTAQSLLAVLQGGGTDEDRRRSEAFVISLSSAVAAEAR